MFAIVLAFMGFLQIYQKTCVQHHTGLVRSFAPEHPAVTEFLKKFAGLSLGWVMCNPVARPCEDPHVGRYEDVERYSVMGAMAKVGGSNPVGRPNLVKDALVEGSNLPDQTATSTFAGFCYERTS
ncbi:hypothetical protein [Erythrobacter ani]|uniref:Uncharacterized protein n=1 Tax=Erythrobacter ani TaxID=2827235 RepID=A0ABS6SND2_9SPHN|nr:hypothetical protein [Erythrobacter ani]MBV7266017.1 hypothetical protein [Erythrobacter ani]